MRGDQLSTFMPPVRLLPAASSVYVSPSHPAQWVLGVRRTGRGARWMGVAGRRQEANLTDEIRLCRALGHGFQRAGEQKQREQECWPHRS